MESTLCLRYVAPTTMPLHIPSTGVTKLHSSSTRPSLSLYIGSTRRTLGHVFSPVIRANDKPPINDKADHKMYYVGDKLKPLLKMSASLVSSEVFKLPEGTPQDVQEVMKQARKGDEPFNALEKAYSKLGDTDPASKYHLGIALVEILICQGKYIDALKYAEAIGNVAIQSHSQDILYKAIIYTMLDEKAKEYWREFEEKMLDDPRSAMIDHNP